MLKKILTHSFLLFTLIFTSKSQATLIDVSFVMDSSGSVGSSDWGIQRSFVASLIEEFKALEQPGLSFRFAALSFASGDPTVLHSFNDEQNPIDTIVNKVRNAPFTGGATYTKNAIGSLIDLYRNQSADENIKLGYLLTDGNPNPSRTQGPCSLSSTLFAEEIELTVLGIGDSLDFSRVDCLVSDESTQLIRVDDFTGLDNSLQQRLVNSATPTNNVNAPGTLLLLISSLTLLLLRRKAK